MFNKNKEPHNVWMSYTDLITGSLAVFIVLFFWQLTKEKVPEGYIAVRRSEVVIKDSLPYILGKEGYIKLNENEIPCLKENCLSNDVDNSGFQETLINLCEESNDLKCRTNGSIAIISNKELFVSGGEFPTQYLRTRLDDVIPVIFSSIENEISKGFVLKEFRIEGHTDSEKGEDLNLELSLKRAFEVWKEIRKKHLKNKSFGFKILMNKQVVISGFGKHRLVDQNAEWIIDSKKLENKKMSRRVEFRIILERR